MLKNGLTFSPLEWRNMRISWRQQLINANKITAGTVTQHQNTMAVWSEGCKQLLVTWSQEKENTYKERWFRVYKWEGLSHNNTVETLHQERKYRDGVECKILSSESESYN